ncbi:MAG: hypothetical protein JXQ82_04570 [Methanomicrobiaceae archaeon]|nr:hypothetical protein [Methanomicrobiaceae archaeon]
MDEKSIRKLKFVLLSFIAICVVLSAGCTGSGESAPKQSEEQAQVTAVQGSTGTGTAATGEIIHNSILKQYLPTATGNWESGEAIGLQVDDGIYKWSWASKTYEQKLGGEAIVDVIIQDTAGESVGYMTSWDTYMAIDTPDMSMKKVTVQGFPGWIVTDKTDNVITQFVNVNDRFMVYTSVSDGKEDYLTVFNTQTDLKGLSNLS